MDAIRKFGRLHEIKNEREELKRQLAALDAEEEEIRKFLEEEALQKGEKKGNKSSLTFNGLGSVSVKEQEQWVITDKDEALQIVQENPIFFEAQKISVDTKSFLKIAQSIYKTSGDLVSCVGKETKRTTRITLAKLEENEES